MAKGRVTPQMKNTADAITDAIDQGVKKVLDSMGVATKDDIAKLETRVAKLESWASAAPAKKRPGRPPGSKSKKKAAGKKKSAKKPGRPPGKKSAKKATTA